MNDIVISWIGAALVGLFIACLLPAGKALGADERSDGRPGAGPGAGLVVPELVLQVGVEADHAPYAFERQGVVTGFDVELIAALGKVMGFRPEFRLGPWNDIRQAFAAGGLDLLAGVFYGEDRALPMVLASPYAWVKPGLVTRQSSSLRGLDELDGREVLVMAADPSIGLLRRTAPDARAVVATDALEALRALAAGRHDAALFGDVDQANVFIAQLGLTHLRLRPVNETVRSYAVAVSPAHGELAARIDTGLAILRANGKYATLREHWFGSAFADGSATMCIPDYILHAVGGGLFVVIVGLVGLWHVWRRVAVRAAIAPRNAGGERLFKEIFRAAGDAILVFDDGRLFDCNARALEIFGFADRKESLGRRYSELSPPIQPNGQNSDMAAELRISEAWSNGSVSFEWLHRHQTGDVFPAEVLLSTFNLNGQKVVQASVRDITARKRTEAALRDSERRMADIINLLPDPILVIDLSGRVQFWNQAMEVLTGIPAGQMLGKGDYEYALPFYGERRPLLIDIVRLPNHEIEKNYANVSRFNESLVGETYVPNLRDGGTYVLATAAPLYDARNAYVGAIEVIRDITQRRRAEMALQDSERRLAHIIEFLPDATVVTDTGGKIVTWNKAMADLTETSADVMLGKGNYEVALPFYGERRPILVDLALRPDARWEATYNSFVRRGDILYGEIYAPVLRGGQVYIMATAAVIRDSRGQPVGAIEIVRDLSERKIMEEAMRDARDAAESATRAKSEFLANMSHEIRTPMNAIIGMTSLMLNTELTDEQRDLTETVRSSGDALLALINDILDFSKIEAGRMDMEVQPFDLRQCLESAVDLVAVRANEKGLDLGCLIEHETPPTLMGDVTRLRQILVNLLNNAIKFTERGEVVLRAVAEQVTDAGSDFATWATLHFSVRDTGIGIPPERRDRLFKSFSQVDASTTRRYGGTGLGLAISARLAELMGGKMWVESSGLPGQGSTFHFTVRVPVSSDYLERQFPVDLPELAGKRVMIVDDNLTNCLILTRQAEGWGMLPETFDSPLEALETIRRGVTFDLAILDMQMPDMDGLQLARGIRDVCPAEVLPLIMLTSLGRRDPAADALGFAAFLHKPIKSAALHDSLRQALGGLRDRETRPRGGGGGGSVIIDSGLAARHPLRILVAEDYAINQKVALYTLSKMGYRADLAANGIEALEALRRQDYDVVLMDVQMPVMDGLEASQCIVAEWAAARRPRIIAMTANAMQGDREICLDAGMDDYITKPVQVGELQAALLRCQNSDVRAGMLAVAQTVDASVQEASGVVQGPAIDRGILFQYFVDLERGDTEVFREMAGMLKEDVPSGLDEMAAAAAVGRVDLVHNIAHTLKGAARSFGAERFSDMCQVLESETANGVLPGTVAVMITALRTEFARVVEELNRELGC